MFYLILILIFVFIFYYFYWLLVVVVVVVVLLLIININNSWLVDNGDSESESENKRRPTRLWKYLDQIFPTPFSLCVPPKARFGENRRWNSSQGEWWVLTLVLRVSLSIIRYLVPARFLLFSVSFFWNIFFMHVLVLADRSPWNSTILA